MIVVQITDPLLRRAVARAAHPEEDVVADARLVLQALDLASPRAVVRDEGGARRFSESNHRVVELHEQLIARWESERRAQPLLPTRLEFYTVRIRELLGGVEAQSSSADRVLSMLSRAAGRRLPAQLRSFGRRVLEFPSHYTSLHPLAETCGLTRGALKARFRRRNIATPSTYLRWFRILAVADVLADQEVTVATAARRCGYTSDGNLCRALSSLAGVTPTEVRSMAGWNRLLITFAWANLSAEELEGWASLDDLFRRRIA